MLPALESKVDAVQVSSTELSRVLTTDKLDGAVGVVDVVFVDVINAADLRDSNPSALNEDTWIEYV
jgi:hypothetical protein